ncbi:zinc ribbon domain-containing protein [Thermus scotoductus]|uniref:zinc ribbon domain-containing protein n=1 Tax=Thermus scotoductus TaxID=37636 RepID=UPI002647B7D7|nr:zinc ribbon domain-containing protein [Thermus scotoductus]
MRAYTCPQCGALLHRDVAAAQNILAKAWPGLSGEPLPFEEAAWSGRRSSG